MQTDMLDILVCPVCKAKLYYDQELARLICKIDRLSYPIEDDIPVMLVSEARKLSVTEVAELK